MSRTVYVVSEGADYESSGVVGVYDNLEDAQAYKKNDENSSYSRLDDGPWDIERDPVGGGIIYWERRDESRGVYRIIESWEVQ